VWKIMHPYDIVMMCPQLKRKMLNIIILFNIYSMRSYLLNKQYSPNAQSVRSSCSRKFLVDGETFRAHLAFWLGS
jgi:hypothetical protein